MPPATAFRRRLPIIAAVGLLHAAFVWLLLSGLPAGTMRAPASSEPHETQITLTEPPPPAPLQPKKTLRHAAASESGAVAPYFDPYTYHAPQALRAGSQGISLALATCDPSHYDMASTELRHACDRIGMLIKSDPSRFGVTADVRDPTHWRRELARREAPFLAPCMTPNGPDALYALLCIYDLLFHGYDPEKRARYSE